MATTRKMEARGSWILRIIIVLLIVVLVTSVLYPDRLWEQQSELILDSQERMENLNFIVQRHKEVNGTYIADLDSLLRFIEGDSILVEPAIFEFEKVSLYDADYDSFLVGFPDRYHFDYIEATPYRQGSEIGYTGFDVDRMVEPNTSMPDSVVLSMIPKPIYSDVIPPVRVGLASPGEIHYYERGKGDDDIWWVVWASDTLRRHYLPYDTVLVPSKDYLLYRPVEDLRIDPISGESYQLSLNARITLTGEVEYQLIERGDPDSLRMVYDDELKTNLFINRLARKARSRLEQDMQRDSTLYDKQLELQGDYFEFELEKLQRTLEVKVEEETERTVPLDSVALFDNLERIQAELYKVVYDSLIREWTGMEQTQDILRRLEYAESAQITKLDTVGVMIEPPFEGEYDLPAKSLLDRIYSVGPIKNPGNVENNDLSWSETK